FFFMVDANLLLPYFFGKSQVLTWVWGSTEFTFPVFSLGEGFERIYSLDFFLITMLTFFAPVLCFIVGLAHRPGQLFRFLSHSTSAYAALGPLSAIGVLTYLISGKAISLLTGDTKQAGLG